MHVSDDPDEPEAEGERRGEHERDAAGAGQRSQKCEVKAAKKGLRGTRAAQKPQAAGGSRCIVAGHMQRDDGAESHAQVGLGHAPANQQLSGPVRFAHYHLLYFASVLATNRRNRHNPQAMKIAVPVPITSLLLIVLSVMAANRR